MEEKKPLISVIVPVYNVEKYLHKCVDSILAQTLNDFELILVDDGSPDNCGDICDEYEKKDGRVKVIHKPNGGVSSARNAGIESARGEWLCFVDGDDWIDKSYLENFGIDKKESDMFMQGYIELSSDGEVLTRHQITSLETSSMSEIIAESEELCIINSPCFKLYKASIIKNNSIRFDEQLSYGEDHVFSLEYLQYINTIATSRELGYKVNRGREGSLTRIVVPFEKMYYYTITTEKLYKYLFKKYADNGLILRKAINKRRYNNINKAIYDGFRSGITKDNVQDIKKMIGSLSSDDYKGIGLKHIIFLLTVKTLPYSILAFIIR